MSLYERWLRPLAFSLDPETAHALAVDALAAAGSFKPLRALIERAYGFEHSALKTTVAGLDFPNPVGLAAGFDKDCRAVPALCAFGFGFIELGTLTPRAQGGNPRPRLFRFPSREALVNRMGFNNEGAETAARRLSRLRKSHIPIGVNIGVNADVQPEEAPAAYAQAFSRVRQWGDYFVVNVSCPNQQGFRRLQEKLRLERILTALKALNREAKPVFVKLSPDLELEELSSLVGLLMDQASGVVCTNTSLARDMGPGAPPLPEDAVATRGGLSGAPLRALSTKTIREVYRLSGGRLPIIGSGGIFSAEDAYEKIRAGASLVQVYTGLVYRGPALVPEIKRGLARLLAGHNLSSVREAVGCSHMASAQP
ncbi:MAG: quinone-dependent dihydroorotate dehydrogenase [Elusimicrobia bacterium]|nr:quinone-dependent dihydroorotate dehydrogenase [Elusimicrobiota bacterium]